MAATLWNPPAQVIAQCSTVGMCFAAVGLYAGDPPAPSNKAVGFWQGLGVDASTPSFMIGMGPDPDFEMYIENLNFIDELGALQPASFMDKQLVRITRTYAKRHNGFEEQISAQQSLPSAAGDPAVLALALEVKNMVQATTASSEDKVALKAKIESQGGSVPDAL